MYIKIIKKNALLKNIKIKRYYKYALQKKSLQKNHYLQKYIKMSYSLFF